MVGLAVESHEERNAPAAVAVSLDGGARSGEAVVVQIEGDSGISGGVANLVANPVLGHTGWEGRDAVVEAVMTV